MEMTGPIHDCPICCEETGYGEAGRGSGSSKEEENKIKPSPQFRGPFAVHLHNEHGPEEEREPAFPAFSAFSWVICRRPSDGKVLLCNEPAAIAGGKPNFWFPAGRVDEGETFLVAGERETLEEAGVKAKVKGVLVFKLGGGLVPRVVLYAEPFEDREEAGEEEAGAGVTCGASKSLPKSVPDFESCGACWLDVSQLDDLTDLDYRGGGTAELYRAVASGGLTPLPLDTPSFAALEEMVQRLTKDDAFLMDKWLAEIQRVWALLEKDYAVERLEME
jgi:phosphatase NudJ